MREVADAGHGMGCLTVALLGMVHANHHSESASAGAAMKRLERLCSGVMGWLERRDLRIRWREWNCGRVLRRRPRAMKRMIRVVFCLLQFCA